MAAPIQKFWSACWLPAPRAVVFGGVLVLAALIAAIGTVRARLYGHDIFFLLDNGWRALHGQRVHLDYSSGWGPVTFLLVAAGMALSGASVAAPTYANALMALAAGLWAAWLAVGRSKTLTAAVYPWFVALLAGAPFALGDSPYGTSLGMVYNRYGYALLAIVMLEGFEPPAAGCRRSRLLIEPILSGCAVGLMLFLKANYFVVVLPLLVLFLWLRDDRRRRALGYAAGLAGTTLVFLAYLRFNAVAMVNDLAEAAAARSGSPLWQTGTWALLAGTLKVLVPLALLGLGTAWLCGHREAGSSPGLILRFSAATLTVLGIDLVLLASNAQRLSFPLTGAFALLLLFSIEPELRSAGTPAARRLVPVLLLLAVVLAAPIGVRNVWGLGYALVESRFHPDPPGELRFESPRLRPLVLCTPADDPDNHSNGREYVKMLNDGMRLLTAHTSPADKVATLDMINPFAYALGRAPIHGGIAAAAYQYSLDDRHHPSPERFFGDAAVVMVPKRPASPPRFYTGYRAIYEPFLGREFHLAAESGGWWLYRRNGPPATMN